MKIEAQVELVSPKFQKRSARKFAGRTILCAKNIRISHMRSYVGLYCKSNNPAQRRVMRLKLQKRSEWKFVSRIIPYKQVLNTPQLVAEISCQSLRWGFIPVILILFFLSGCLRPPDTIKDVRELRQDHASYLKDTTKPIEPLPAETQAQMNEDYNIIYFSVWHQHQPFHASPDRVLSLFKKFGSSPGYGENKKKHSVVWINKLQQNAFLDNYPNALHFAITTRHTNLRMLPTQGPHFYKPGGDIAGWPFDNLQISSVAANTPIFVCHLSADKSWALR
jgi:NLPC_P60 stabilising domain, N term/SH3 domain (SH3b1 type)